MLRSILVRQTFVLVDLTLAVLFVATAAFVIYSLLRPAQIQLADPLGAMTDSNNLPQLASVESISAYDALVNSGLFGDSGRANADAPPPPEPVEPPIDVEETKLNLRLIGTTAVPGFSSAVIEEADKPGTAHLYVLDENIMDKVTLVEVSKREVIILNEIGAVAKRERLGMDDDDDVTAMAAVPEPEPAPEADPTGGVQRISLNRTELMQDIMTSYPEIASKVKPELARDEQGNVLGVTANGIGQLPLARKLGLGEGDILQTVNNESIDSEQKIYEMINKYQNAASLRIGVISGGKPKVITYRLN